MMNHSAFDDHIRKQFGDFSPEVPPHIWENIARQKDKRRPGAWWTSILGNKKILFTLIAILLGTAGFWLYTTTRNQQEPIDSVSGPAISQSQKSSTVASDITKTESNNTAGQLNRNQNADQQEKSNENNPDASSVSVTKEPATSPGNNATTNEIKKGGLPDASSHPGNSRKTEPVVSAMNSQLANKPSTRNRKQFSGIDAGNTSAKPGGEIQGDQATHKPARKQTKDKARMMAVITDAGAENIPTTQAGEESPAETYADLKRKVLAYQLLQDEKTFNHKLISKSFNLSPIPCPEKNAAGNKKYFEVYGSADYAFRKFNDTAHSQYLQKRRESTSFSSAFSAGLRYTRVFSNAMSFRIGLNYSQVNEKFRYVQGNIVQVVYIINASGDTTGSFMSSSTRYKITQNRYKTIDIPITIGYEIGNEKLHANLNAGVFVNVYSWQKGDVLDTAYLPVSITTGKGQSPYMFKTNIGLGFTGAASVYYKLNNRLHLLAEPYIRYNLSPANKAEITLKQKFTTIGLRLGLRLDL